MYLSRSQERTRSYFQVGLVLSLALHVLIVWLLLSGTSRVFPETAFTVEVIDAKTFAAQELQRTRARQYVTDSEVEESKEEVASALLASKNVRVEREQIKRGEWLDAGASLGSQGEQSAPQPQQKPTQQLAAKAVAPPKQEPASKQPKEDPKQEREPVPTKAEVSTQRVKMPVQLKHLTLTDQAVAKLTENSRDSVRQPSDQGDPLNQQTAQPANYRAFSRPSGSGAAFIGLRGSTDYLPNLPDGDLTLLNTKADRFAVFVRRVASQVFGQLRSSGWEQLRPQDIHSMTDFTEVRASLSLTGELLSVRIVSTSGSSRFDEVVLSSAKRGVSDPNPPAEAAAADGTIKFIFRARSWSRYAGSPRTGAPMERRWLLLATGLE